MSSFSALNCSIFCLSIAFMVLRGSFFVHVRMSKGTSPSASTKALP